MIKLKEINKKQSGRAFILVLILLLVGGLIITPLLAFMVTGLKSGQMLEERMFELYAADAGVEHAIYNIITPGALYYADLQALEVNEESVPYTLTVNDLAVTVTVTKLSTLSGLLSEDELAGLHLDREHAVDWVDFEMLEDEIVRDYNEGWVEYTCHVVIDLEGNGNAKLESVGAFFSPIAGDQSLLEGPYGFIGTETGVMDFAYLQEGSPETKFTSGGFTFIWRFEKGQIEFKDNSGGFSFKFKIHDPDWAYSLYFVWSTLTRADISFATNAPDLYKWLIEAKAKDTTVRSAILEEFGVVDILTWEINPP